MKLGLDFGLTNLDCVLLEEEKIIHAWRQDTCGPATKSTLKSVLESEQLRRYSLQCSDIQLIAATGGRHQDLPNQVNQIPIHQIAEAEAVGRGGLKLAKLQNALVVSAGTGTSMIASRTNFDDGVQSFTRVTGSAVGGGTLLGLSRWLLGTINPLEIAELAEQGHSKNVDSTLFDVIGSGIGNLPADATAVNLGRLAELEEIPTRQDLAAGLVTLVAQVIAVIALNAAKANQLDQIVIVGHLPDLKPIRTALARVWDAYDVKPYPIIPENAGFTTAFGAASAPET